jgi:hypothetical protein
MEKPLSWLDMQQDHVKRDIYDRFGRGINLLEKQIDIITAYVRELGRVNVVERAKPGTSLTFGQLKKSDDARLVCDTVSAFLMFQALDNLQAARLNILHGYLSVTSVCLRNVVEALLWANLAQDNARIAHEWLNGKKLKKPHDFVLDERVHQAMKLYDTLSKCGGHPAQNARRLSTLTKPEARRFLGDERRTGEIESYLDLVNRISADYLSFLREHFPIVLQQQVSLRQKVYTLLAELREHYVRHDTLGA